MARACTLLYVELGANDGSSFAATARGEPGVRTAGAILLARSGRPWHLNQTCMHAFEPNPAFRLQHGAISRWLAPALAELKIHTAAAVTGAHGARVAYHRKITSDGRERSVGNTVVGATTAATDAAPAERVRAVRFEHWLREAVAQRPHASLVLRFDVEGGECSLRIE